MPAGSTTLRRVGLVLAAAVLAGGGASPAYAQSAALDCEPDPVRCPSRPYLGAFTPGLPRDLTGLEQWGEAVGKQPSVALYFQTFNAEIDLTGLRAVHAGGRLPMLTWEPFVAATPTANPFPLRDIAAGRFDAYLQRQAETFAAFGQPVALRLAHEMNGNWYPWGRGVHGNTDADYVAMWRHVHDLFTAAGADNVIWLWSPNVTEWHPSRTLVGLYPGDEYVDWVGLTGYFAYTWDRFRTLYRETLPHVDAVAPRKPLYIAETSVLPGPDRPAQIQDLMSGLLSIPRFIGVNWFESDARYRGRPDWRITDDATGRPALAHELASPWYLDPTAAAAPIRAAPLVQVVPTVSGTAETGRALTATTGTWLSSPDSGALTYSSSWFRCTSNGSSTSTCAAIPGPAGTTAPTAYTPRGEDFGRFLRLRTVASNAVGSTVAWSAPTSAVVTTPATPAAPPVEARDRALRVTMPPAPLGTTHWQLSLDGVAKPLVPVGTGTYWLVPLVNARTYTVTLRAAAVSATTTRYSPPVQRAAVPMSAPWSPYVKVDGGTAVWKLPPPPPGATRWTLTVNGTSHDLPTTTTTWTERGLNPGRTYPWTLAAGSAAAPGVLTPAVTGSVTPAA